MINLKVPGKLYIAGEYAVVENGFPSILTTVDRFVKFQISKAQNINFGTLYSKQYAAPLKWQRINNQINLLEHTQNTFEYVLEAITITEKYLQELGYSLSYFDLVIDSELDSENGKKFGLGSSAAVTVGVVKALLKYYHVDASKELIFKLAALAHYNVQGNGSLGDIAAIAYTGWLAYYSVDRTWLAEQSQNSILNLIESSWPDLKIIPLKAPLNLKLLVGWSGSPASTKNLITKAKQHDLRQYDCFLKKSKECVEKMITAFKDANLKAIQNQININRHELQTLSNISQVNIETPQLTKLIEIANHFKGAAKTSGAGGGDCGIAIFDQKQDTTPVFERWRSNQILPLEIKVYQEE